MSSKYLKKLEGQRVLIFGGTSGIGYAVAEASIENGASIAIAGSNQERLNTTAKQLQTSYPDLKDSPIETHVIDLSRSADLEGALPELLKQASHNGSKPIDHIVWTAGDAGNIFANLDSASLSTIQSAMAVRLIAPALLGHAIVTTEFKYFNKSPSSSITFTGGSGTTKAVIRMVGNGLEGLVAGLAVELGPIRVNVVHPGLTLTEKMKKRLPEQALEGARKGTLTQQLATPEDLAEAYLYVMKSNAVTGQVLNSDSGKTIHR